MQDTYPIRLLDDNADLPDRGDVMDRFRKLVMGQDDDLIPKRAPRGAVEPEPEPEPEPDTAATAPEDEPAADPTHEELPGSTDEPTEAADVEAATEEQEAPRTIVGMPAFTLLPEDAPAGGSEAPTVMSMPAFDLPIVDHDGDDHDDDPPKDP